MTKFTVSITGEGGAVDAKDTQDADDALDWFTNAATEVMDEESDITAASLAVDGAVWGSIQEGGLEPDDGAKVVPMRKRA